MPTVASKLLNYKPRTLLNVKSEYYAGAIFASSVLYYWGPSVYKYIKGDPKINNNDVKNKDDKESIPQNVENLENLSQNDNTVLRLAKKVPALNIEFILQFLKLIQIMVPGIMSKEMFLLSGHTISLIIRTFLSIYVASMEGQIVKYIVRKDAKNFIRMLMRWFSVALPATFINSMIRYLESKLALSFRTRLVEHSYQLYFKNQTYYRTTVLDSRLDNCAQRLTDDIETVASVVARLYSQITKPLFDLLLIGVALARLTISAKASLLHGPILCCTVVGLTGYILKVVSPRFGQLVAVEAEKKGKLRHVHARLIANAEEIAFFDGHKVELFQLRHAYRDLCSHMTKIFGIKLWFVMLEQFLMKYVWSGMGMIVVSLPILLSQTQSRQNSENISERTQYFTTAKNLLQSASDAVERLMSSYKEIVELAGHTQRVQIMFEVFEDTSKGIYKKNSCISKKSSILTYKPIKNALTDSDPITNKHTDLVDDPITSKITDYGQPIACGHVVTVNNEIKLTNVPIVTPNFDIVCEQLSFELKTGQNLLITGPNGCGKSSLFRILSGLWPIYGGELKKPLRNKLFYIPQRPYLTIGSLRDQLIYPDSKNDLINKQKSESDLVEILKLVKLEHIVKRDGFDSIKDWTDILSGGEKQRLAMARLFYHKPTYALLDECTSAISIDVEASMYQTAIDLGITLLTITHRPTLWRFHTHILQFDGCGNYTFGILDAGKRLALKNEKAELLEQPKTVERDLRLKELSKLLGEAVEE